MNASAALRSFAGRRVLVTGHTGFKGSWLCLWLQRLGAVVTGFSDSIPTDPSHFAALDLNINDQRGDIADAVALDRIIAREKPDLLFHFAAQSLVRRAYADPISTYRTNVLGTLTVLEAARRNRVGAAVVATTDKVYRNDESGKRYREEDELGGSDPYSASKSCAEIAIQSYRESFVRDDSMLVATVRAGNVIGGGDWAEDRLVPDLVRAAFSDRPAIVRNPSSMRPWQHVLDVLAGYLEIGARLTDRDSTAATAWNLGPVAEARIRVADIIEAVRAELPRLCVELAPEKDGLRESVLLQLDSAKAMTRLGWRPLWEGSMIKQTIEWYRSFYVDKRVISGEQLDSYEAALTLK